MSNLNQFEENLSQSAPKPDPHFTAALRQRSMQAFDRIHTPVVSQKTLRPTRRLLFSWGSALALALLVVALLTPPGRALAQSILQFGLFLFTHEPTVAERNMIATPAAEDIFTLDTEYVDLASASAKAGFTVYYPAFVPAGYVSTIEIVRSPSGTVESVDVMFELGKNGKMLFFTQRPWDYPAGTPPINFGTGDATPQDVTVAGNKGIWLENIVWGETYDENGKSLPVRYNMLIWQKTDPDGHTFQFWLQSEARLPLDVMLRIAESAMQ